jgi:hypothetical protein
MQDHDQAQEEILRTICEKLNHFIQDPSAKLQDYDLADFLVKPFEFGTAPSGRWISETADPPPHVKEVSKRAQVWADKVSEWEKSLNKTASYSSCLEVLTALDDAKTDTEIQSCTRNIRETIGILTGVCEGFEKDSKDISSPKMWSMGQTTSWFQNDSLRKKTIRTWVDKKKRWFADACQTKLNVLNALMAMAEERKSTLEKRDTVEASLPPQPEMSMLAYPPLVTASGV